MNPTRKLFTVTVALLACATAAGSAIAQSPYPSKPIRIIASAAPGGTTDLLARVLAEKMSVSMGQPVIVENKAGAGGNIAAEVAARSAPDGYTVVLVASSHASNVGLYSKLGYDPVKDFAPVTQLVNSFFAVAVPASSPVNTLGEFVALAKKGKISYSSAGSGQGNHLGMEMLKRMAGFDAVHVPYGGIGPATTAVLGGTVDVSILTLPGVLPHVKSGKLKVLAVTGPRRSSLLPQVPTVAESGFPGYQLESWQGVLAPAGTPRAIVDKLHAESVKALRQPDVMAKLASFDLEPVGSRPDEFAGFIKTEIVRLGKMIKDFGAKAE